MEQKSSTPGKRIMTIGFLGNCVTLDTGERVKEQKINSLSQRRAMDSSNIIITSGEGAK